MVEVFRQDYSKVASNAMLNPTILSMQVKRQGENFPLRRTLTTPHTVSHWTKAMCWSSLWAAGRQKPWQIVLLNFTKPENEEESMWTNIFWTFTKNKCAEDVVTKICKELSIYFCKKKILCKKKNKNSNLFLFLLFMHRLNKQDMWWKMANFRESNNFLCFHSHQAKLTSCRHQFPV